MSGRHSSHINYWCEVSSDKFQITDRTNNAQITGARFGWLKLEHDSVRAEVRARFYTNRNDAEGAFVAASVAVLASTLPASLSLVAAGGSGVSGTVTVNGLST